MALCVSRDFANWNDMQNLKFVEILDARKKYYSMKLFFSKENQQLKKTDTDGER